MVSAPTYRQVSAHVFLLADRDPPGQGETAVVSTSLGATNTALQSMLAEETCATYRYASAQKRRATHVRIRAFREGTLAPGVDTLFLLSARRREQSEQP